jgi:hypothetical protein
MRSFLLFNFVTVIATFHINANADSFASKYALRSSNHNSSEISFTNWGIGTKESLVQLFSYDDFVAGGQIQNPNELCYLNIHRACKVLSQLSANAIADYVAGIHESVELTGCEIKAESKVVVAQLKAIHDWETVELNGEIEIQKCERD